MNDTVTIERLLTRKTALGTSKLEREREDIRLTRPEVLAELRSFAVTTNNITYGAFGEAMDYWAFFPSNHPEWGHIPVWGFADIVASNVPGSKSANDSTAISRSPVTCACARSG
jgi:Protein of unknown function (DUF2855)